MGEDVYLEGALTGSLELECSRCLVRYRDASREPFRLVLEPAGSRIPAEPEAAEALARDGMCLGDEFETGWFRGDEIDLGAFVREVITLALPVQPLCQRRLPRALSALWGRARAGRCGCEENEAEVALRGAGHAPPRAERREELMAVPKRKTSRVEEQAALAPCARGRARAQLPAVRRAEAAAPRLPRVRQLRGRGSIEIDEE